MNEAAAIADMAGEDARIDVIGGRIFCRVLGAGDGIPLVAIHGGPGAPSDYFETLEPLARKRRFVRYDQLGCGLSDRPADPGLWRRDRFVDELGRVLGHLGARRACLLGHSWGSMIAVDFALRHGDAVAGLVLASPCLNMARVAADMDRLRAALPAVVRDVLDRHEAAGTTESGEYQVAAMAFYRRHICRSEIWPEALMRSVDGWNMDIYRQMWGPSEFTPTGELRDYDVEPRLRELTMPVLYLAARHDEIPPDTVKAYRRRTPDARLVVFENSAHVAHIEEPAAYIAALEAFLTELEHAP